MKKIILTTAIICVAAFTSTSIAQEKKESQEIIIRKKGDKDTKITIEINGDKININGKPLSEFKDDEITINKRNVIIRDGKRINGMRMEPNEDGGLNFWNSDSNETTAFLGVTTSDNSDDLKNATSTGAKITEISKGSAAEKAGLKSGDVIVKINDKEVKNPGSLSDAVTSFKPKDEVTIYYNRDGKDGSTKAVLGERKESKSIFYSFSGPDGITRSFTMPRVQSVPGVDLRLDKNDSMYPRIWSPRERNNMEYFVEGFPRQQKIGLKIQDTEDEKGVKVLEVDKDSPAEKAGLKKDDVITEIAGDKVSNTDEAREELQENMDKAAYKIKVNRSGTVMSFDIKIPKKLKTANL